MGNMAQISKSYFLLIKVIGFPRTNPILVFRISSSLTNQKSSNSDIANVAAGAQ